jgi:hypothetical protein
MPPPPPAGKKNKTTNSSSTKIMNYHKITETQNSAYYISGP